jgi:hypothetical protein
LIEAFNFDATAQVKIEWDDNLMEQIEEPKKIK